MNSSDRDLTLMPEQPPIGGFCETCGHFAARHNQDGCQFPGGCKHGEVKGDPCKAMKGLGVEWPRPWLEAPQGLRKDDLR